MRDDACLCGGGNYMPLTCRRCLLAQMETERPLFQLLTEWLAEIAPENRADAAVYEARLSDCRQCDWLHSGLCARCGCYVELRAAIAGARCPDMPQRWLAQETTQAVEDACPMP